MDWLALWLGGLDLVRVEAVWPGLDRGVIEEILDIASRTPLWHVPIFLIGFPLSRVEKYEVRLILRDGGKVMIRRKNGVIEVMIPEKIMKLKFPVPLS